MITTCFNTEIEDSKQFVTHGYFILVIRQNNKVVTVVDFHPKNKKCSNAFFNGS